MPFSILPSIIRTFKFGWVICLVGLVCAGARGDKLRSGGGPDDDSPRRLRQELFKGNFVSYYYVNLSHIPGTQFSLHAGVQAPGDRFPFFDQKTDIILGFSRYGPYLIVGNSLVRPSALMHAFPMPSHTRFCGEASLVEGVAFRFSGQTAEFTKELETYFRDSSWGGEMGISGSHSLLKTLARATGIELNSSYPRFRERGALAAALLNGFRDSKTKRPLKVENYVFWRNGEETLNSVYLNASQNLMDDGMYRFGSSLAPIGQCLAQFVSPVLFATDWVGGPWMRVYPKR